MLVTLLIETPKTGCDITPQGVTQMFTAIHRYQAVISFELTGTCELIKYQVTCPVEIAEIMANQLQGWFPRVRTRRLKEMERFPSRNSRRTTTHDILFDYYLGQNSALPITVWTSFAHTDPMGALLSLCASLRQGEGIFYRLIVAPQEEEARRELQNKLTYQQEINRQRGIITDESWPIIQQKLNSPQFEAVLRLEIMTESEKRIEVLEQGFAAFLHQFQGHNFFKRERLVNDESFSRTSTFSTAELPGLWHLPIKNAAIPTTLVTISGSNIIDVPTQVSEQGLVVGYGQRHGKLRPVAIADNDRFLPTYILGAAGMGKSTLLLNMLVADIYKGRGVCLIDPHGDLFTDVLNQIPPHRQNDVILFDPTDTEFPVGLNLLERTESEEQDEIIVDDLLSVLKKLSTADANWGIRMEQIFRLAVLILLKLPQSTILDLYFLLTNDAWRIQKLSTISDPFLRMRWETEFEQLPPKDRTQIVNAIIRRLTILMDNKRIRNIVTQARTSLDLSRIMDEGRVLLVNLSKELGENNSSILGSMLVSKLQVTALKRASKPSAQRRPFQLYIDEFQNFATPSFATIMSEARKYGLYLTIANQYISQLSTEVRQALLGNVGCVISFKIGVDDAPILRKHFGSEILNDADFVGLDRFRAYVKMSAYNQSISPFSMVTPQKPDIPSVPTKKLRDISRQYYARPRTQVETDFLTSLNNAKILINQQQIENRTTKPEVKANTLPTRIVQQHVEEDKSQSGEKQEGGAVKKSRRERAKEKAQRGETIQKILGAEPESKNLDE